MTIDDVATAITAEIQRLVNDADFEKWLRVQRLVPGGLVVINNSFVFRDVDTNKAAQYVAVSVDDNKNLLFPPLIVSGPRINSDFKYLHPSANLPSTCPMDTAVAEGVGNLGELLFILIGEIDDSKVLSNSIDSADFDAIVWKPSLNDCVEILERRLEVGQVYDEDAVWDRVLGHYQRSGRSVPAGLREAVGVALDKLQEDAVADIRIAGVGQTPGEGITDRIVTVLREQMTEYNTALSHLIASPTHAAAQNDILRIAYNFASDATGYLRLIVSICDLKPLVLWGTVSHHYALSEAFRNLPWTRSRNKPSLKNYVDTISDARNSAFHNLFPFRKSLKVRLTSTALADPVLILFSEYGGKKKEAALSFRDKPIVDVLTGFKRARERRVSTAFWEKNQIVMDKTISLFEATSHFVKLLHSIRR